VHGCNDISLPLGVKKKHVLCPAPAVKLHEKTMGSVGVWDG
jgi:hypothetical protein